MIDRMQHYFDCGISSIKLLLAWTVLHLFKRGLFNQNIWLIEEKHTEERDNGYHLFSYLCKEHPEIGAYYVITKDSADIQKVTSIGKVIDDGSFRHYLYFLGAKYNIGSQPYGAAPQPASWNNRLRKIYRKDQKLIFLQHGITKDDLPMLYYENTHYDLFVSGAKPEYDYILKNYGYTQKNLKLLGFCRFDNLHNSNPGKTILVMPTFRKYLAAKDREHFATEEEVQKFKGSSFYQRFSELLTNEDLKRALKLFDYNLIFYLHYSLQSFTECFRTFEDDTIIIADRLHFDVQRLLMDSAILVTDFSSVFFDFAYMEKPEIYFQPDEKEYRTQHYSKGYFDYCKDGFGPVFFDSKKAVDYLIDLMRNDCIIEKQYLDRINSFFAIRDIHNCERTFQAICDLE